MAQRRGGGDDSVGAPRGVDPTAAVDAATAVDRVGPLEGVEATKSATAVEGTGKVAANDSVSEVAAALRAGQLTVDQAVDRLIEDALSKQVGRAIEPGSEVEQRLRRVLRDYAGADPLISAKISRLQGRRPGK